MYKSKLLNILDKISMRELKKFGDYVISPFFNKNEKVISLFELLAAIAPNYTEKNVERTLIFEQLFPKETFKEQKLRYVMADLTKLLEGFITHQQLQKEAFFNNYMLLNAYAERDIDKYFYSTLKAQQALLQKNKLRDGEYYLYQYLLETADYWFSHIKSNHIKQKIRNNLLASLMRNLDVYYTANKLKYLCEVNNNNNIMITEQPASFLETQLLEQLQQSSPQQKMLLNTPPVTIYHQILRTLIDADNETHYENFIEYLNKYASSFKEQELYDIQVFMRNYCLRRYNSGDSSYLRKIFDLYKLLITKERLLLNNSLSQWDYKNIVTIAILLNEMDFAKKFIYQYRDYINKDSRNNVFTFSLAFYYYAQKNYNETIKTLHKVEFTDPYYHIDSNKMLMKCYYELNEIAPLFSTVNALKRYIRRNKQVSKINKSTYLLNLKFAEKLARIKSSGKRYKLPMTQKLRAEIANSRLNDTKWLYTKIEMLEQKG